MASVLLSYMCPLTFIASDPVSTESEKFPGSGVTAGISRLSNLRRKHQFSKNFRGKYWRKIGFQE